MAPTTARDFEDDEWIDLLAMPGVAGFAVVLAQPNVRIAAEVKAMAAAAHDVHDGPAHDLITEIIDALADLDDAQADQTQADAIEHGLDAMFEHLARCGETLDRRCTRPEAAQVKRWILRIADATASARREGGFLGIGAVRVSEAEREAIERIRSALSAA